MRWIRRALLALLSIPLFGAAYQAIAAARDQAAHPPRGELVTVDGRQMHLHCTGTGGPVVMLDHGWTGGWSLGWSEVQPGVALTTRVCSYDRAGYGWSDSAPAPRTSARLAAELHALLESAGVPAPYVLVGHSFGGYTMPLFAKAYPSEVGALVLVDPSDLAPPKPADRADMEGLGARCGRDEWLARLGVRRLFCLEDACSPRRGHSEEVTGAILAQSRQSRYPRTVCEEGARFYESQGELARAGTLGNVPMVVLVAGKKDDDGSTELEWRERQVTVRKMCELSTRCTVRVADNSGHRIPEEQPGAVVEAIAAAVEQVRKRE